MSKRTYMFKEVLEVLTKSWCNIHDLMIITSSGETKAFRLKKEILTKTKEDGYYIFDEKKLPMDYVIKYLNINIKGLKEIADIEKSK